MLIHYKEISKVLYTCDILTVYQVTYHYDPTLTWNIAGFWHILGERPQRFLFMKYETHHPLSRESQRFSKHLDLIRRLWLASSADVCRHENIPWVAGICSRSAAAITPHWYITQTGFHSVFVCGCGNTLLCLSVCLFAHMPSFLY